MKHKRGISKETTKNREIMETTNWYNQSLEIWNFQLLSYVHTNPFIHTLQTKKLSMKFSSLSALNT